MLSLAVMSNDERVSFDRAYRPLTASEELAIHNGYISFKSLSIMEFREGIYILRRR